MKPLKGGITGRTPAERKLMQEICDLRAQIADLREVWPMVVKMCRKGIKRVRRAICRHSWRYLSWANNGEMETYRYCYKCETLEKVQI